MLTSEILCEPLQVGEDEVILTADYARVSSASQPGHWYTVAHGTCDCTGYSYRKTCRHVKAAEIAQRQFAAREPVPAIPEPRSVPLTAAVSEVTFCPSCGKVRRLFKDWGKCAECAVYNGPEEVTHAS